MRTHLHGTALRFTRNAAASWTLFLLSLGLLRFDNEVFWTSDRILAAAQVVMQASFAAGCLFFFSTLGVVALDRSADVEY